MMFKKSQMKMIVNIALIILGFIIIIGIINQFFNKAEGKTSESICRGSVAARNLLTLESVGDMKIKAFPLLCKTLDVSVPVSIPKKEELSKDLAMKGISDYTAKTWWMFGEGAAKDVFGTSWGGGPAEEDRCMIMYNVKIKGLKNNEEIKAVDIQQYLATTPYIIEDAVDGCVDFGGWCVGKESECTGAGVRFKDHNSICEEKYGENEIKKSGCCYHKDGCVNKGGRCLSGNSCGDDETKVFTSGWDCSGGDTCCINKTKAFTYLDYVQRYNYEGNVGVQDDLVLKNNDILAISYISELAITVWPDNYFWEGGEERINRILISSLDTVSNKCSLQSDIGGE